MRPSLADRRDIRIIRTTAFCLLPFVYHSVLVAVVLVAAINKESDGFLARFHRIVS